MAAIIESGFAVSIEGKTAKGTFEKFPLLAAAVVAWCEVDLDEDEEEDEDGREEITVAPTQDLIERLEQASEMAAKHLGDTHYRAIDDALSILRDSVQAAELGYEDDEDEEDGDDEEDDEDDEWPAASRPAVGALEFRVNLTAGALSEFRAFQQCLLNRISITYTDTENAPVFSHTYSITDNSGGMDLAPSLEHDAGFKSEEPLEVMVTIPYQACTKFAAPKGE